MDKVKEVVNKVVHPKSSDNTTTGTHSSASSTHHSGATGTHGTAGPHQSNVANKADPRVDSDLDGSRNAGAAQYGTGAHNTNSGLTGSHASHNTAGPHSSDYANKADPRVDSDLDGSRNMGAAQYGGGASHNSGLTSGTTGTTGFGSSHTGSTNAGPHNSNLMNKADARVDSDRDGKGFGAAHSTPGTTGYGSSTTGTSGLSSHSGSTNAGPHNSNLLNKADPRVDSDRDGKGFGAAHSTPGTTGYGSSTTGSSGLGSSHATSGSTNAGPHNSNMLNKLDPRVDSDRDGKTNMGAAEYGSGAHHNTGSTNYGEHNSNLMNKADPRIDSDRDGSRNYGAAQSGPGAHHTTDSTNVGPHKSNILNKLDPRVDSDRDGSKTYGQQQY